MIREPGAGPAAPELAGSARRYGNPELPQRSVRKGRPGISGGIGHAGPGVPRWSQWRAIELLLLLFGLGLLAVFQALMWPGGGVALRGGGDGPGPQSNGQPDRHPPRGRGNWSGIRVYPVTDGSHKRDPIPPTECGARFFVPGVRKSGTTSMYSWIAAHPGVHGVRLCNTTGCARGETNAFLTGSGKKHKTNRFAVASAKLAGKITGDASVTTLECGKAIKRIVAECGPEVRFVVLLRDPVSRARSLAFMRYSRALYLGLKPFHLKETLDDEVRSDLSRARQLDANGKRCVGVDKCCSPDYVQVGKYDLLLDGLFQHVDASQVFVVYTEDLKVHARGCVKLSPKVLRCLPTNNPSLRYVGLRPVPRWFCEYERSGTTSLCATE